MSQKNQEKSRIFKINLSIFKKLKIFEQNLKKNSKNFEKNQIVMFSKNFEFI